MRPDPIISGAWIKAALVILVAGALGVGAYVLTSGVDINLPDLPDVGTNDAATTLSDTTLEDTTIGDEPTTAPELRPEKPAKTQPTPNTVGPTVRQLQELNRCTQAANGDIDKITACFDRFSRAQR
jgi:hypothetical protein